jgi:hypothetical protein
MALSFYLFIYLLPFIYLLRGKNDELLGQQRSPKYDGLTMEGSCNALWKQNVQFAQRLLA